MLSVKKLFHLFVLLLICVAMKRIDRKQIQRRQAAPQPFHEVDAFGDDFIDFGAETGPKGAFSWHADFPVNDK